LKILDEMPKGPLGGSVWDANVISQISNLSNVEGVIALGTVLAITLKDEAGGGYTSSAAEGVKQKLLAGADGGMKIHSRVLGNVIYFMTGLRTKPDVIRDVEKQLFKALEA
jgi:dethiobiotin synthetase/adenosylmethionine--8-amino-7-oxononanoate aminotransferase